MLNEPSTFALAAFCALLAGIAKTGMPALGIAVAGLIALVVPPKESIGLILPLLIIGDTAAVLNYRKHANIDILKKLLPWVFVGVGIGAIVLNYLSSPQVKPFLGSLILCLLAIDLYRRRVNWENLEKNQTLAIVMGLLAGFCTVTGNVAGPLMVIYFILLGMPKYKLMGTGAWFFFIVNFSKVPVYVVIDVITLQTLKAFVYLAPFTIVGTFIGVKLLKHINQVLFERLIFAITSIAASWLIISSFL